jgi:hypothetical protein
MVMTGEIEPAIYENRKPTSEVFGLVPMTGPLDQDSEERIIAFSEKRSPEWKGR